MKVKELIDALKDCDPEMEVILQKDSEGNSYSYLSGADPNAIEVKSSKFEIDVYDSNWNADEAGLEKEIWSEYLTLPRCVVLYPEW